MRNLLPVVIIFLSFTCLSSFSQDAKVQKQVFKFGDVKSEDFNPKVYELDSNASAIVLADIGSSKFEGNSHGFFSIIYKRFQRIRILNKNGFDNSKFQLVLHNVGSKEERFEDLQAATYNLDNGTVTSVKLDKSSVFTSNIIKGVKTVKFSLPNVKEGSIIECSYIINTPFFEYLRSWNFQRDIPTVYSQYEVKVPKIFDYVVSNQGSKDYDIRDSKTTNETYNILVSGESAMESSQVYSVKSDVFDNTWAIKNIPAFKNEAFTSSPENYVQKLEFQLRSIHWAENNTEDRMGSWASFASTLLKSEYFGKDLDEGGSFSKDIDKSVSITGDQKQKAIALYNYVRDNFTCTNSDTYEMDNSFKKIYQSKKGNVAEINLLLTSIYRSHGLEADPVILSTKDNGKVNEIYPLRRKYNYVITRLKIDNDYYLVDAADKSLGFGMLAENEYNGTGRLIAPSPVIVPMYADSLKEKKTTTVFIVNSESGKEMEGSYKSVSGTFESIKLRKHIRDIGESVYKQNIKKGFLFDINIKNEKLDSLSNLDKPVSVSYDFDYKNEGDLLYFNPLLTESLKKNPFTSEDRLYPVEMPYRTASTYVLNMEIPKGYKIDELPKSAISKLNGEEGFFEYMIGKTEDNIQLRVRLVLNRATFDKEDYKTLRDFYAFMVKKESEMIVFKKIN